MQPLSRKATALIFLVLLGLLALTFVLESSNSPASSSAWKATSSYPLTSNGATGVAGQPCFQSNATLYCIGGQDGSGDPSSQVYSAPLTSNGIGNWTESANSYPTTIMFQPCVNANGYVYCVGGIYDGDASDVAFAYYAQLTSSGIGGWRSTTSYPIPVDSQACVSSSGFIYCVGGENETAGTNATAAESTSAWYAPISSSGIGHWNHTSAYPSGDFFPSCTSLGGYIYCLGGEDSAHSALNTAYYAELSSSGIGPWTATTAYPFSGAGQDCVTSQTYIYCVGGWMGGSSYTGDVYAASLSPGGIGPWTEASPYPDSLTTSCVLSSSGYLYCVGGYEGSSGGPVAACYYGLLVSSSESTSSG